MPEIVQPRFSFMKPHVQKSIREEQTNRALDSAAKAYRAQCDNKVKQLQGQFILKKITKWDDLGIDDLPLYLKSQPLTFESMMSFLIPWKTTAEARFKERELSRKTEVAHVSTKFERAKEDSGVTKVGRFTLKPRQKKAVDRIIEIFTTKTSQAVMVPLEGGEGKSVIGWAVAKYWQDHNYFDHIMGKMPLPNQVFFSTAAAVAIDMEARGIACGVANINKFVMVISHTSWASKDMKHFFREEVVESYGNQVKKLKYIMPPPAVIIVDENDAFKKPTSLKSKYILAVIEAGLAAGSVFIFMSATPGVTVNDMWLFAIATGRKWNGEPISMSNWPALARSIAARAGCSPSENSAKAMAEFRKEFNDCYVVPPRDPRKYRAYNKELLLEFATPEHSQFYARTMDRYYEELERIGQGGMDINKMTAFLKLRQSEEWLKSQKEYFPRLMYESWKNGFASVCGVAFEASVNEIVRSLVYNYGVPRNKISVIQGGSELITKDKLRSMIGDDLFDNIGNYILRFYEPGDNPLSPRERTAVKKYIRWTRERVRFEETEDTQSLRQHELSQLGLGKQSLAQRHLEKEKFQNGETEFMIFTLSSGGRGIDLDHQFEHVRPREGFFTICYWAEELAQAMFRLSRAATISNVTQWCVYFANTLVANHVRPRVRVKLNAIRAGTSVGTELADETIQLLDLRIRSAPPPVESTTLFNDDVDPPEGFDADKLAEQLNELNDDNDD